MISLNGLFSERQYLLCLKLLHVSFFPKYQREQPQHLTDTISEPWDLRAVVTFSPFQKSYILFKVMNVRVNT